MDRYSGTVRINYIGIIYVGIGRMYQGTQVFLYIQHCVALDSGFSWNGPYAVRGRSHIHRIYVVSSTQSQLMVIIFNEESKGILTVPARNAPRIMQQCSAYTMTPYARRLIIFIQNAIEPSMCVYILHIPISGIETDEQRGSAVDCGSGMYTIFCIYHIYLYSQAYHPLSSINTKPISFSTFI